MKVVQMIVFTNQPEAVVNAWLNEIPAEDIVSVKHQIVGFDDFADEYVTIFYRTTKG